MDLLPAVVTDPISVKYACSYIIFYLRNVYITIKVEILSKLYVAMTTGTFQSSHSLVDMTDKHYLIRMN